MAGFEDRLLSRWLGQMRGQSLLLQQRAFCIHLISISPVQLILLPQPPFSLHCPHLPSSSPHSWLGPAPSPSLSSAWHLIQMADKRPPAAQVKPLIETCSLHWEVTIFHLISAKCRDNP